MPSFFDSCALPPLVSKGEPSSKRRRTAGAARENASSPSTPRALAMYAVGMSETRAVVVAVQKAISSGAAPAQGKPPVKIVYDGQIFFLIKSTRLKCAGCKMALVPQYEGGMTRWTKAKARWVARHVGCTSGLE